MVDLLEARRRILLNTPHLESISGATASFETDMANKLKECKVYFTPIQEGTGDPSPSNVRPIHGWDGVTVTRCGKNLCPLIDDTEFWSIKAWFDADGVIHNSSAYFMCDYKKLPQSGTYTFSSVGTTRWVGIGFYDASYTPLAFYQHSSGIVTLTASSAAVYYRLYVQKTNTQTVPNTQLELSSTPTTYEPYTAQSLTIPFPQTIYGGYVDLVKGEVVETHTSPTSWTASKGGAVNQYGFITYKADQSYVRSTSPSYQKCNTISKFGSINISTVAQRRCEIASGSVYVALPEGENVNNIQVVYRVATPLIHTIDPVTIRTLKGINNIWSNANGNIEIKFWTH